MAITKLDLYNPEWLELVFDNKNKDYGAYDLRKHYAGNLLKSMAIAFFSVAILYTGYTILKPKPKIIDTIIDYKPTILPPPTDRKDPIIPPAQQTSHPQTQVSTVRYPTMVPTEDINATNPPEIIDLKANAIGTETKKGTDDGANISIPEGPRVDGIKDVIEDTKPKEMYEIQVLPQPFGGEAAWAKFLQKNLHYPAAAVDAHIQGRVYLSFIIEKDGHISDIVVEKGVGFGLDQEAVRVLKLAPAWKPGIQNGHQVRVKFNMPISFQLSDPD
jgi:protein TonB